VENFSNVQQRFIHAPVIDKKAGKIRVIQLIHSQAANRHGGSAPHLAGKIRVERRTGR
jgi:hypothetical protein